MSTVTAADARHIWSCVPYDCKSVLAELKRSGRLEEARPIILREAECGIKMLGKWTAIDICVALELAAEHYLADHHAPAQEA